MHARMSKIKPVGEYHPLILNRISFAQNGFLIYYFFYADMFQNAFQAEMQKCVPVLTVRKNWISSSPSPPSAMAVLAEPGAVD